MFVMSGITAQAAGKGKYFKSGDLYYHTISKNKVEVCGTKKDDGTLTIPSSVYYKGKKYTVTQIADHEFYYQDTTDTTDGYYIDLNMPGHRYYRYNRIDGKMMPADIDWISTSGITKVVLPSTVTYIGEGAFGGCDKLETVVFANSYKKLTIGKNAFGGTALDSIRFPKGTYELKDCAAGEIAQIYIPATVKKIGAGVVNYKTQKVIIDKKNKKFKMKKGILYTYNEKTLIGASAKVVKKVKISSKTTKITKLAFAGTGVTSVTLNQKIKNIPDGTFYKCANLTEVKNTNNVTKIGYGAFANCRKLQSIGQLPKVTDIGRAAFWGDGKLSLNLPACAVNVDEYAFAGGQTAAAINVTVDANNPACGIENGLLIKTTDTEKIVMLQLSQNVEKVIIPEGVTNVAVFVGGKKCKEIIFPASLKKQNGVACVKNGTIVYQSMEVPEFGQSFSLVNTGYEMMTIAVPKGTYDIYKKAIEEAYDDEEDDYNIWDDSRKQLVER